MALPVSMSRPKKPRVHADLRGKWRAKSMRIHIPQVVLDNFQNLVSVYYEQQHRPVPSNPHPADGIVTLVPTTPYPAPWSFYYDTEISPHEEQTISVVDGNGREIWVIDEVVSHLYHYIATLRNEGIELC